MEYDVLKKAIEKTLQVYNTEITPESTFETALGADSIDMAQIFKLVEEELGFTIPVAEWAGVSTVQDAYELICRVKHNE